MIEASLGRVKVNRWSFWWIDLFRYDSGEVVDQPIRTGLCIVIWSFDYLVKNTNARFLGRYTVLYLPIRFSSIVFESCTLLLILRLCLFQGHRFWFVCRSVCIPCRAALLRRDRDFLKVSRNDARKLNVPALCQQCASGILLPLLEILQNNNKTNYSIIR